MSSLTKELILEKLTEWTPSSKVQDLLGLSSMDDALFKKELLALEEQGVIERDGVRRGLKFRAALFSDIKPSKKVIKEVAEDKKEIKKEPKKESKKPEMDTSHVECQISLLPKHEFNTAELNNVAIGKLINFVLKGNADTSRSLVIKRVKHGIVVKTYNEAYMLSDVLYTKDNFRKLLKNSGISSEDSND